MKGRMSIVCAGLFAAVLTVPARGELMRPAEGMPVEGRIQSVTQAKRELERFEDLVLKVRDILRETDPEGAKRLEQVYTEIQSTASTGEPLEEKVDRILSMLKDARPQVFRATDEQGNVVKDLDRILEILMGKEEPPDIDTEREEIRTAIGKIDDILDGQYREIDRNPANGSGGEEAGEESGNPEKGKPPVDSGDRSAAQGELAGRTDALSVEMGKASSDAVKNAADAVSGAAGKMGKGAAELAEGNPSGALGSQKGAAGDLEEAKKNLEDREKELDRQEREKTRLEVKKALARMLEEQREIRKRTQEIHAAMTGRGAHAPTRAEKSEMVLLAGSPRQESLTGMAKIERDAADLWRRFRQEEIPTFAWGMEQIASDAGIVRKRLASWDPGSFTQKVEREIERLLEQMIEALEEEPKPGPSTQNPSGNQPGQPQEPPLVADAAQLKLLKWMQIRVKQGVAELDRSRYAGGKGELDEQGRETADRLRLQQEKIVETARKMTRD